MCDHELDDQEQPDSADAAEHATANSKDKRSETKFPPKKGIVQGVVTTHFSKSKVRRPLPEAQQAEQ